MHGYSRTHGYSVTHGYTAGHGYTAMHGYTAGHGYTAMQEYADNPVPRFVVLTKAGTFKSNRGGYSKVGLVETYRTELPVRMRKSRKVRRVIRVWGPLNNRGKNTAFVKTLKRVTLLCDTLNALAAEFRDNDIEELISSIRT